MDHVGSASYVTKLDLLKGYWQVPLTPRAREISAFVTPDAFLEYTVMPFGMRNAPATFQRLVNTVLMGLSGCAAYLDDIVVYSSSWSEHILQLSAVFGRLRDANLMLNLAKCEFGQATITYLGKVVGRGQVKPVLIKVDAIVSFPAPRSRRELRHFLGMAGYYRSFCKNFSPVAAPLTDLLSPKARFVWTDWCQRAFEDVKSLMVNAPLIVHSVCLLMPVTLVRGLCFCSWATMAWSIPSRASPRSLTVTSVLTRLWKKRRWLLF